MVRLSIASMMVIEIVSAASAVETTAAAPRPAATIPVNSPITQP
jgi:hypothetical protein